LLKCYIFSQIIIVFRVKVRENLTMKINKFYATE